MHLVQKRKEIHNITGSNIVVDLVPDWESGKRCFKLQLYQDLIQSMNNEAANSEATVEVTLVSTPQKRYCAVLDSS